MNNNETMTNEVATKYYNQTIQNIQAWENKSIFNSEKYKPEIYKLLESAYRLKNHIIAIGEAELLRNVNIINICNIINEKLN